MVLSTLLTVCHLDERKWLDDLEPFVGLAHQVLVCSGYALWQGYEPLATYYPDNTFPRKTQKAASAENNPTLHLTGLVTGTQRRHL